MESGEKDSLIANKAIGFFNLQSENENSALLTYDPVDPERCPLSWQYGGDIAANIILAAATRLPKESPLKPMSVHIEYIKPGDMSKVRNYHVEKLRQSDRFMHTMVTIKQNDKYVATGNVTFHVNEHSDQSLRLSPTFPDDCPMPDQLIYDCALLDQFETMQDGYNLSEARFMVQLSRRLGFAAKPINPISYFRLNKEPADRLCFWIRFRESEMEKVFSEIESTTWSAALLAYASDYRILCAAVRQAPWFVQGRMATMSHAMWFAPDTGCQMISPTEWLLYDTHVTMSGNNTVLCEGNLWNEKKQLLATVKQLGLARPKIP